MAHGCKIRSFDWPLRRKSIVLTCFPAVDSLLALSPSTVAAGAVDFPGLQIIDLQKGLLKKTLHWENNNFSSSSKSTVQGIEDSEEYLFGSFKTCRQNASVIVKKKISFGPGPNEIVDRTESGPRPSKVLKIGNARNCPRMKWAVPLQRLLPKSRNASSTVTLQIQHPSPRLHWPQIPINRPVHLLLKHQLEISFLFVFLSFLLSFLLFKFFHGIRAICLIALKKWP